MNDKVPFSKFQTAIKDTIIVGQCFGLIPVTGVCDQDPLKLRFKFNSWRCVYTYISILLQFGMLVFFILSVLKNNFAGVHSAAEMIFYTLNLITTILFLRIAMRWPELCKEISNIEAIDPTTDSKLRMKFNVSCCLILTFAFVEHLLSELHFVALAIACQPNVSTYEAFLRQSFFWIFSIIPFNNFTGPLIHLLNIQFTFNWSYVDHFVICMSLYLTSRLEQINQRVVDAKDMNLPPSFWRAIRNDYNKAAYLVRKVDSIIGGIVLISFANNLFFGCAQLLHTLASIMLINDLIRTLNGSRIQLTLLGITWEVLCSTVELLWLIIMGGMRVTAKCRDDSTPDIKYDIFGYAHSIYFLYSFIFLVARSLTLSLTASKVYLTSLKPAHALYDVSAATYCIEIKRLLDKIHGNTVALTGLQCFYVKRGVILTIAGTIITYELVLLQLTGIGKRTPELE